LSQAFCASPDGDKLNDRTPGAKLAERQRRPVCRLPTYVSNGYTTVWAHDATPTGAVLLIQ